MSYTIIQLSIVTLMLVHISAEVEGKRGCRSFGHSCYGGLGKRNPNLLNAHGILENPALANTWNPDRNSQLHIRNNRKIEYFPGIVTQWINNYKESRNILRKLAPRKWNIMVTSENDE